MLTALLALACAGCDDRSNEAALPGDSIATAPAAPQTYDWVVDTVDAPRFRAHGWGNDTLWGIARGRVAFLAGEHLQLLPDTAWGVWAAPGTNPVAWTNGGGLFGLRASESRRLLTGGDTPPEMDWGPELTLSSSGGTLLTWTSEAGVALSLLEEAGGHTTHRFLRARLAPGYFAGTAGVWLNSRTIVVAAVAMHARSGETGYRESGYRGNLALLDIERDSMWLVTDVPDGTFLRPEGLLHPDTLLVGVYQGGGHAMRHVAYHVGTWTERPRLDQRGRAAACGHHIALLRPASDPGGEPIWDSALIDARGVTTHLGRYQGHAVRTMWDAACRKLAIAQESETHGERTVVVRQRP